MKPKTTIPTILLITASFIWGLTFVTQKLAGYHMGAFTYNAVRFALGAISLTPVFLIFEREKKRGADNPGNVNAAGSNVSGSIDKTKHTVIAGLLGGSVLFIASNLQQFGIILNEEPGSASIAGFITGLYLIFTPLLGLMFGRKARPVVWIACVIAFAGLALISIVPDEGGIASVRLSDGLLLIGAVFWAVHILIIDRFAGTVHPIRFTAVQFGISAVLSAICAFGFETVSIRGIMDGILPVLFGGVIACTVAYTLQIVGQRNVEPSKAAIIFSLEALVAAIAEAVWFNELMSARKYIGGAIILAAILLTQTKSRNEQIGEIQK